MRVGMVGAGWVTQYHLPAWAAVPGAEVVAICDPDRDAAARRADAFGIAGRFDGLEAMLAGARIDALDICSPRRFHAGHVRAGARRGLAMLCQKPLGVDLAEAEALVGEIGDRAILMVHENWRFRPYYRRLGDWLAAGLVGDIVSVRLDFHSSGMLAGPDGQRPALARQPFMAELDRMLVMEVLIHHLDTLRFLLGALELHAARLRRSTDAIVGEDSAVLGLSRLADGAPVALSGNLAVHGAPAAPVDRLEIIGTAGTIRLEGAQLRLDGPEPRAEDFDPDASYRAAYAGAIAHFAECVRRGTRFETHPRDNLETLRLVEKAYVLGGLTGAPASART